MLTNNLDSRWWKVGWFWWDSLEYHIRYILAIRFQFLKDMADGTVRFLVQVLYAVFDVNFDRPYKS